MIDKSSDDIYLSKNKEECYRKTLIRYKNGQTFVLFLDALDTKCKIHQNERQIKPTYDC